MQSSVCVASNDKLIENMLNKEQLKELCKHMRKKTQIETDYKLRIVYEWGSKLIGIIYKLKNDTQYTDFVSWYN